MYNLIKIFVVKLFLHCYLNIPTLHDMLITSNVILGVKSTNPLGNAPNYQNNSFIGIINISNFYYHVLNNTK